MHNYRYNRLGGIDADRTLDSGEVVPTTLTEAEIAEIPPGTEIAPYVEPAVPVPQSITMRQTRLALLAAGKLADVETAIAAMPEPQRTAAQIEWEYAATVERASPLIAQLGAALGLDEAALDEMFRVASNL